MQKPAPHNPVAYAQALFMIACLLTGLGLLIIYSSSSVPAVQRYQDAFFFFRKQAIIAALGFASILVVVKMPFRWLERLTIPLILVSLAMLVMTLIPGLQYKANGANRWIRLVGFTFQPAELAKLALVLFLAKSLSRKKSDLSQVLRGMLPNLAVLGCLAFVLMLQPDFGSTFLLFSVTFVMFYAAGLPAKFISLGFITGISGVALAIWHAPYRMARLVTFLDPWRDIQRGGFQIIQSYLGFQNGGLFGSGLGESKQKLYFLPEAHTDFILSVIGEELGLIGVLLIVACFFLILVLGLKVASVQTVNHRKFLAFGLTSLISMQAALNMGVTMGLLPTKGMPLPFVSNGASSLSVFLVAIGILIKLAREASETSHESHVT